VTALKIIDLNCDMGEGIGNDAAIMPWISSTNIACGYHAGDDASMLQTIQWAKQTGVAIGAHVSFADKENFGRTEMNLSAREIHELVTRQLVTLQVFANTLDMPMLHIKPHGALYNMSARDPELARVIAGAARDFDENIILFGLSGSHSIREARIMGLQTINEVFADRSYEDDGSLTPRNKAGALINDINKAIAQATQMVKERTVTTITGKVIPVAADSICIHGDGAHAVEFAKGINEALRFHSIEIKAPVKSTNYHDRYNLDTDHNQRSNT
jgi:5-oxoprolinase (ATP-hydrolysing) subunit A